MRRAKLIAALVGLFTLAAVGCNETPKPTDKSNTPAKPADGSGPKPGDKPAEGSGPK